MVAFLPDAGIEDAVRKRRAVGAGDGYDGLAGELLPVEQQGIVRDGHHVAHFGAVIDGDHAIVLDQRRARKTTFLGVRIDGVGQILPVDEVVADGVAPMLTRVFGGIGLVEEMPAVLPEAEPVWIVERVFRLTYGLDGPVGVALVARDRRAARCIRELVCKRGLLLSSVSEKRNWGTREVYRFFRRRSWVLFSFLAGGSLCGWLRVAG